MTNPVKGEARLELADGRTLTLAYDFDAMVEVEELAGVPFGQVIDSASSGGLSLKHTRALLAGGLKRHHAEMTITEIGDLLLSDGQAVGDAITAAMANAMGGAAARPPKGATKPSPRRRGTGTRSSKAGAKAG